MLAHINIRNFAIADKVDVEFGPGMTALTGETGAGKSILVDALGLVLGDRADSSVIRHGSERAEISVGFDIRNHAAATDWLKDHELDMDGECQLRRIINREGRSRGFINNQSVPMQSLRELGERLVDIHGQHEHQSLLRSSVQRQQLDAYAEHGTLLSDINSRYREWAATRAALEQARCAREDRDARIDLLRYQVSELDALGVSKAEVTNLGKQHDRLANAEQLLTACQRGLQHLNAETGTSVYQLASNTLAELEELSRLDNRLESVTVLLNEILLLVQECTDGLRGYSDGLEIDPGLLQQLEERMGVLHDLARKHHCKPDELPEIHEHLREELDSLEHADRDLAELQARLDSQTNAYREAAQRLSASRRKAARKFGKQVSADMQHLGMPGGVFEVAIRHDRDGSFTPQGMDSIEFMVSTNPGQPPSPLSKVASGGELSRISLAIQVICLKNETIPTLIFDEVDTGIGGGIAEIVGQKLRALGAGRQVFCVTHLPQVAALGASQIQVCKLTGDDTTRTRVRHLDRKERIDELARMLGGVKITSQTRKHAREMLAQGQSGPAEDRSQAGQS
ncbi:MAG: DNA repair protein RecN [Gammaproteobacteria bacterium]|nr:MAG: DNA repair protein RecN [Gammaproteobacteria bacterium]